MENENVKIKNIINEKVLLIVFIISLIANLIAIYAEEILGDIVIILYGVAVLLPITVFIFA